MKKIFSKFSIIIPSFNRIKLLERAINSLIKQTHGNWEALIIDNHSKISPKKMIDKYQDKRLSLYRIKNRGVIAKSRNYGIKKAKGDFIAFLDSDDWWLPNKLEISLKYLKKYNAIFHELQPKSKEKVFF